MLPVEAWAAMKKASESKDLDEFRDVILLQLTLISPSLT